MKTAALLFALASSAGLAWVGVSRESAPAEPPAAQPNPPAEPAPVLVVPEDRSPVGQAPPPAGLPGSVNLTVCDNGSAAGTYPLTWAGTSWTGNVVVGTSGPRPVVVSPANGQPWQLPPLYYFHIAAPGGGTYYTRFLAAPFQLPVEGDVSHGWSQFVGGHPNVVLFRIN